MIHNHTSEYNVQGNAWLPFPCTLLCPMKWIYKGEKNMWGKQGKVALKNSAGFG